MLGEHAPSYVTVKNWVAQFKRGDFSTCDVPRPERPKTVTTPEIIDQIHELIVEDWLLFFHDNASAHWALTTQKKLAYLGFQYLDHPPHSPSDYHLFPGLKKQMKGRHFSSDPEVIAAAETWLDGQHSDFFLVACLS